MERLVTTVSTQVCPLTVKRDRGKELQFSWSTGLTG